MGDDLDGDGAVGLSLDLLSPGSHGDMDSVVLGQVVGQLQSEGLLSRAAAGAAGGAGAAGRGRSAVAAASQQRQGECGAHGASQELFDFHFGSSL